jgi:transketolase
MNEIEQIKRDCLHRTLSLYKKANAGHIGSSLSCLDLLVYIFFKKFQDGDKVILSKGHAALALYVVLAKAGFFPESELETFYEEGTFLAAHPPCGNKLNGILFGTGSLGHGLSLSTGLAFSNKFTKKKSKIYCIISEGDCNEGSTWEAALFAGQHKLSNLVVILDNNRLQGFGNSEQILDLNPIVEKWQAFNFEVSIAKLGNDFGSIEGAFNLLDQNSEKPKIIIAQTTKGSGISFMENKMEWHYLPMSDEQYNIAIKEITV